MGRALFALSRSSRGDVSDMAGRVCDQGRERPVAEVVGWERNEMDVEMDWRVSTSVHVPVVRLKMVSPFQCTIQATAALFGSILVKRRCCMGGAGGA